MSPSSARIIDANLNRAREALRVMEDYARFALDDPAGCEALKRARHALADAARMMPASELLAARDTAADVGTAITTPSEQSRGDARDVFIAAAKRLPEALRTIEEYAKTFAPQVATAVEAVRYQAYCIEQRLLMRGERSALFAKVGLYVIVTAALCRRDWLETAGLAIAGGAGCIQLREMGLEDGELLARARRLVALCRERGAICIINDRPDIALLADADGVHLGQTDMPPADARRIIGPTRLIGLSTHNQVQLRAGIDVAPDYLAVGPMFDSPTKPQPQIPGPALLATALRETQIPIVPIGGITAQNAGTLRNSGAKCLCVCSAVISAPDPKAAAAALRDGER